MPLNSVRPQPNCFFLFEKHSRWDAPAARRLRKTHECNIRKPRLHPGVSRDLQPPGSMIEEKTSYHLSVHNNDQRFLVPGSKLSLWIALDHSEQFWFEREGGCRLCISFSSRILRASCGSRQLANVRYPAVS